MNKITSIVEFSNWHKQAVKFPAYEQVMQTQKINNQLMERLVELQNKEKELREILARKKSTVASLRNRNKNRDKEYKGLKKISKQLTLDIEIEKNRNIKLTNKYLIAKYTPLATYREAQGLTYKALAALIGIDKETLRNLLKYGYPSKYESKVNLFIKSLQMPIK